MGYRFTGFLARADATLIYDAQRQWPSCVGQKIAGPFAGIVVRSPDPERAANAEADDQAREIGYLIEDNLPGWSSRYPGIRFVFVVVDCSGGNCLYRGFVCQNGLVGAAEPLQPRGAGALLRLMAHLGVQLGPDEYFAPFGRTLRGRGGESAP